MARAQGHVIPMDVDPLDGEAVQRASDQIHDRGAAKLPLLLSLLSSNAPEPQYNHETKSWEGAGNLSGTHESLRSAVLRFRLT